MAIAKYLPMFRISILFSSSGPKQSNKTFNLEEEQQAHTKVCILLHFTNGHDVIFRRLDYSHSNISKPIPDVSTKSHEIM